MLTRQPTRQQAIVYYPQTLEEALLRECVEETQRKGDTAELSRLLKTREVKNLTQFVLIGVNPLPVTYERTKLYGMWFDCFVVSEGVHEIETEAYKRWELSQRLGIVFSRYLILHEVLSKHAPLAKVTESHVAVPGVRPVCFLPKVEPLVLKVPVRVTRRDPYLIGIIDTSQGNGLWVGLARWDEVDS